ncbi:MAG: radical SAM protein, partial [Desulfobulbaceae bacterium]|nr:radical SAM protein [Desulfobulbaceae bacterium]
GGSFTGLAPSYQRQLLAAVHPYLEQGLVGSVRLSTRPDSIDGQTASFLRGHGVEVVELGVQSLDEKVLAMSRRGHSVASVAAAFGYLKEQGLRVGGQLMIGLPGETTSSALAGAQALARLGPDLVRIYPTLVIRGSDLAALHAAGGYRPLSLLKAVALAGRLKEIFDRYRIPVVRMGLQPGPALERDLVAGPYHPAFGELVLSRLLFKQVRALLAGLPAGAGARLAVAPADQSILRGPGNRSLRRLEALGLARRLELVFDPAQPRHAVCLLDSP